MIEFIEAYHVVGWIIGGVFLLGLLAWWGWEKALSARDRRRERARYGERR